MMRTALIQMANYFPDEPLYSLMLLDYYVPSKMYEEAVAALRRTYDQFEFDDAAQFENTRLVVHAGPPQHVPRPRSEQQPIGRERGVDAGLLEQGVVHQLALALFGDGSLQQFEVRFGAVMARQRRQADSRVIEHRSAMPADGPG